ncbi:DUF4232 domain-containing protein [Streptomyces sp. cmx-18-6]|uniref:DUF4232 domain-containing protein n=1 Tax=Streptomyces sp. cmx-18-6 TaxID=2790930 RepID=UPI00397FA8AC
MSSIRNSRTRLVTTAVGVALAALSLTACDEGTGTRDEGAAAGSSASASPSTAAPGPSESGSASGSGSGSGSAGSGSSGEPTATGTSKPPTAQAPTSTASGAKAPAPSGKAVTCEGSNTKTVAAPLTRPINHMLLTVTNTGSTICHLYGYPAVRFGEAQSVPPVIEDSRPQAVVTLKPGESGFASVNLSAADGSGAHGRTEKSLTVYFQGRSGTESVGSGARPSLPGKGVHIDDSLKVTYWQQSMGDAISS